MVFCDRQVCETGFKTEPNEWDSGLPRKNDELNPIWSPFVTGWNTRQV